MIRKTPLRSKCRSGKKRYRDRIAAELAIASCQARKHERRPKTEKRAYRCEACQGWHVTSWPSFPSSRTPLPKASAKRQKEQRQRSKMLRETFGPSPACVRCGRPADDLHELLSRARGGSVTDPSNCVPLCRPCHSFVTTHPVEAAAEGLALRKEAS